MTVTEAAPNAEWDGSPELVVASNTTQEGNHTNNYYNYADERVLTSYTTPITPMLLQWQRAAKRDHKQRRVSGRHSDSCTSRPQGRYITSKETHPITDLAFDATLRVAAIAHHHRQQQITPLPMAIHIQREDLRQKVRVRKTRNAVCFVVDASSSMAARERMHATRRAILSLLHDAYQRRDYVGMVSFQRTYATILLPLTNSVELAHKWLHSMPVGGKTPLSRGLLAGYTMLEQARRKDADVIPLLVIITDGQANVSITDMPPQLEAYRVAAYIATANIKTMVIDSDTTTLEYSPSTMVSAHASRASMQFSDVPSGMARHLADYLNGNYYRLDDFNDGSLAHMVRMQLYR